MKPKPVSSDKQKCSVLDCKSNRSVKSHRYPRDKSACLAWMNLTGNPRIRELKCQQICENRYVICCHHFKSDDYACGVRRKLKSGSVPSLLLPEGNENAVSPEPQEDSDQIIIDPTDDKGNFPAPINVTPPQSEFSPITFRNWIPKTPDSGFCRKTLLVLDTEWNNAFGTSAPKSRTEKFTRKELFPERKEFSPEKSNVVPGCISQHVTDATLLENVDMAGVSGRIDETCNSFASRPSKRTVWKKMRLDEKTREMYEHVLEAKRERDANRTKSKRNSTEKGFSMKSFPITPEKRELWMKMIARPDWDPGLKSRVCEAHFTSEMWEKTESGKKLSHDAVPTMFPKPPTRPKNAEKKIIRRRRNKVSVLSDHAYVNKAAQVEVRLPNLPKVVLALNAEEAGQLKRGPEPKSILQKNVQSKIGKEALIALRNKLKLVSLRIVPSCSEEPTKKIDAQENNTPELPKILKLNANVATQLQRIHDAKSIPQEKIQPKNADRNPTESVRDELKLVNGSIFPPCPGEQTKKLIDIQEKKIELPKVVLKLNANQAIQIQRIREPESILQKSLESTVPDGIPIEEKQEELKLVNRPIFPPMTEEQMKKRIESQGKKILQLQKKLTKLRFADRKLNRENSLYQTIIRSLFSEDQIELLMSQQMNQKCARSKKWSVSTIQKANSFKSICGNVGYLELLKLGYPFPSLRTLNREKSKLSKSQESLSPTLVDMAKNVSKKLSKNVAKRNVKDPKKLNGELIIDEINPEAEMASQAKKSKTEVES